MDSRGETLEGIGILSQIPIICNDVEVILYLHVFDINSFNLMIGLPFGRFLGETPVQGKLDVRIGVEVLSVRITGAKYATIDPLPDLEPIEEVKSHYSKIIP
jgi:hypothetical protein